MVGTMILAAAVLVHVAFVAIALVLAFRVRGGSESRTNAWKPLIREGEFDANSSFHHGTLQAAA